jgi:hypothetical protein
MKSFVMWKMPILLCGLGAALLFSPACKAQSEIDPDHFDGTDSWEVAYRAKAIKSNKTNHKPQALHSKSRLPILAQAQPPAAPGVATPEAQDSVAIADKRKAATRKASQQ